MVRVQLHYILEVAGHAKSCALRWYDLIHDIISKGAKFITILDSPYPELPKMR
jgi:hypothetical protein